MPVSALANKNGVKLHCMTIVHNYVSNPVDGSDGSSRSTDSEEGSVATTPDHPAGSSIRNDLAHSSRAFFNFSLSSSLAKLWP